MTFVSHTHQMLGYLMVLLVALEFLWSTVETITDSEPGQFSSIKSRAVVGLLDLQVLLGIINSYLLSMIPYYHVTAMILAAGAFHVGNKQSGWGRVSLQISGTFLVVLGIGLRHMM